MRYIAFIAIIASSLFFSCGSKKKLTTFIPGDSITLSKSMYESLIDTSAIKKARIVIKTDTNCQSTNITLIEENEGLKTELKATPDSIVYYVEGEVKYRTRTVISHDSIIKNVVNPINTKYENENRELTATNGELSTELEKTKRQRDWFIFVLSIIFIIFIIYIFWILRG